VRFFADSICANLVPPVPVINYAVNPCLPNEVAFSDSSLVSSALVIDRKVWKISNGDSATGNQFTYRFGDTGTYTIQLSLYSGSEVYSTDTVVKISSLGGTRFLNAPQTIVSACAGSALGLYVSGAVSYSWQPCNNLSNCNSASPVITPAGDMVYTVTGRDQNNCVDSAQITVKVITNDKNNVHVPTAFTPNGDGNNDTWGVLSSAPLQNFNLRVFDRWGINVFNSKDQGKKWDGRINGAKAPTGTYVWVLNYKNGAGCADMKTKGTIMLIR
jgi:gliding motility-associated-like protein